MRGDAVARLEVVLAVIADLRVAGVAAAEPAVPLVAAVSTSSACPGRGCRRPCRRCAAAARRRARPPSRARRRARRAPEARERRERRRRRRSASAVAVGRERGRARRARMSTSSSGATIPRSIWPIRSVPPNIGSAPGARAARSASSTRRRPRVGRRSCERLEHARAASAAARAQRRPVACANAFAIAAAVGMIGGSPSPLAPVLPAIGSGMLMNSTTIAGVSAIVGTL